MFVFFLEVRFGCGSSREIKTADIERIMYATVEVVTFKKKHTIGGKKIGVWKIRIANSE